MNKNDIPQTVASRQHPRIIRELKTVRVMIEMYCRAHHEKGTSICESCQELETYAFQRLANCPFQDNKTSCGKCFVHCYKPSLRKAVKDVMRFAGPRMLLRHPLLAVAHLIDGKRAQRKNIPPEPKSTLKEDGGNS